MNPPGREPREFDEVFRHYSALLIVGGQAVNLWAEALLSRDSRLGEFVPFLSKDADLFGPRSALDAVAPPPPGWKIVYYSEVRQSAIALLTKPHADGRELRVEVMRSVHGVSAKDLANVDLIEIRPNQVYRLPSPLRLLKAKIANTHDLTQRERPQDLKHVRMLVLICGHYLRDMHASVLAGATPERSLINALNDLHSLLKSPKARAVASRYRIDFTPALPLDLPTGKLPKLVAFYANFHRATRAGRH